MIFPSIASANPLCIREEIQRLGTGNHFLHIDIEDGNFLPNITFGLKFVRSIRQEFPSLQMNAHLMVSHPESYLDHLSDIGICEIAMHLEALPYPLAALNKARALGMIPGLALNFATPVSHVLPFINDIEFLLIMTSEPDSRGDLFHSSALKRISEARTLLPPVKQIWVDGGIGETELAAVRDAGAQTVIMGRAIFHAEHPEARLKELQSILSNK